MLDTATKKRIDDCRDILVGKLPDPKAQIEQITIALIYKFMDDMDQESIELGGKAKFFMDYKIPNPEFPNDRKKDIVVPFEKYAWHSLFDTKVTATEMLLLYSDAIMSMDKNPNLPPLFRDIFKNAFLPYRDPETLKLFLKTIGEFEYTHSEKLGDAFEYLLSVMGSQGDAGQFRTPRHIIDFVVKAVDPSKTDRILDPACGTAGFLISAFKHIRGIGGVNGIHGRDKACLVSTTTATTLTPDERKKIMQNVVGYDISPDMVRLSLVNLYLHGFSDPHIFEYDALSSEERWDDNFDMIFANPPFMSPKGGIRPHKKFSISSNRSEVLFVDYIAEHLNPKGKAGIIVPEGVIFQSGTAYKALRKMLVEKYLYAVVSLPAGVFNPYSGVKTSILLMDKELAKKKNDILFVKIDNDGYGLGAQRNSVKGGQLEEALEVLQQFKEGKFLESKMAHAVAKKEIAKNDDYNLSGERYRTQVILDSTYDVLPLGEIMELNFGERITKKENTGTIYPVYGGGGESFRTDKYNRENEFVISRFAMAERCVRYVSEKFWMMDSGGTISISEEYHGKISKKYLGLILSENQDLVYNCARGGAQKNLKKEQFYEIKIPLPPLSIQEEIVAEIEGYQKIIDGAKAIVENYKPKIDIDPDWEMVKLGKLISTQTGGTPSKAIKEYWDGDIPWVSPKDMKVDYISDAEDHITEIAVKKSSTKIVPPGTILIVVRSGILQHTLPIAMTGKPVSFNQDIIAVQQTSKKIVMKYLFYYLKSSSQNHIKNGIKPGVTVQSFHNGYFKNVNIPLPDVEMQCQIIAQIQKEQSLVNANKQLIVLFEQKIKNRIAKVWGDKKKEYVMEDEVLSMVAED